jgi:hypothetical protein
VFPESIRSTAALSASLVTAVVVTAAEIALSTDLFRSAYNWYHLE